MRKIAVVAVGLLGLCIAVGALAASDAPAVLESAHPQNGCGTCHVSATPAHGSAELKPCPRPKSEANEHSTNEAPDVIYIKELSQIYVPVVFPHKLHASMTEMTGGCEVCHHQNPPGRILKCGECHGGPSNPTDLKQPGLKGAYHRQCLGCHREWTHETDCAVCHAKREPGKPIELPEDPGDIMGRLHPNIEVPDFKVYTTEDMADTPMVTFHHKEHAEAFAIKCVNCHREENCSRCHDPEKSAEPHVREDAHEDCTACHEQEIADDCTYCHKAEQTKGFDHEALAGYALQAYHREVTCRKCHPGEGRFTKAEKDCEKCHAPDWAPEEFDHALTGQPLDDLHKDLGCAECHPDGMGKKTSCASCHGEARMKFPKPEAETEPAPAS